MKKIGLLTFHDTTNFGSWLQTYALYTKVQQLGYLVEVIDYECWGIKKREKLTRDKIVYMYPEEVMRQIKKQIVFGIYLRQYMKLSSKKYHIDNISKCIGRYDVFLLGSDLTWDLNITYGDTTYLFDFLDNRQKICAFAASSGREKIPCEQRELFSSELSKFSTITVREESMKEDIGALYGKNVQHVCDPTILLDKNEWSVFIKKRPIKEKYVLLYWTDGKGNLSRIARKYAREKKLRLISFSKDYNIKQEELVYPITIKDFLSYIYYAEKIFTSSYHGMMFSLIFNKQFAFFPFNPTTRMISAANKYGVYKQFIDAKEFDVNEIIDYEEVNKKINSLKEESITALTKMLNGE